MPHQWDMPILMPSRELILSHHLSHDKNVHTYKPLLKNVPLDMCAQRRHKSACASAQYDQDLRYSHEETLHPWLSKCTQRRFWSDIYEGTFPDFAASQRAAKLGSIRLSLPPSTYRAIRTPLSRWYTKLYKAIHDWFIFNFTLHHW